MHGRRLLPALLALPLLLAGCRKAEVTSYQIPKEQDPVMPMASTASPVSGATAPLPSTNTGTMATTPVPTAEGPGLAWDAPSRWTAGGSATSKVVARMDLNGFYLIQDTRQMRDGKESFATHGVFTYDREDRTYKLFWHDSLGYYPPSPASGGWAAKSLILVRGSLRGNARHVYEIVDDNTYNLKIQFSPDAEGWNDVLTGVYRRAG